MFSGDGTRAMESELIRLRVISRPTSTYQQLWRRRRSWWRSMGTAGAPCSCGHLFGCDIVSHNRPVMASSRMPITEMMLHKRCPPVMLQSRSANERMQSRFVACTRTVALCHMHACRDGRGLPVAHALVCQNIFQTFCLFGMFFTRYSWFFTKSISKKSRSRPKGDLSTVHPPSGT